MSKSLVNALKFSANKKPLLAIALVLMMTASAAVAFAPSATAHTPAWTIPTYAYVTAAPNTVGVGQTVALVFWLDIPPPTASSPIAGDRWEGFKVTITKPDGTTEVKGPFLSDPVGSNYALFTPTTTGTYTVKFEFPGQVLKRGHPTTGILGSDSIYINDTYTGSSATTTFLVQQDSVPHFEEAPLPVSYWTRPINENNQQWSVIASHWLGQQEYGATYSKFQPYGWAPNTAHVINTYPLTFGGIVGGGHAVSDSIGFYSGTQYQLKFSNPIIMYGNLYFSLPKNNANTGNGVTCVDLRTGETKWTNPNINSVTIGQLYDYESANQHGTTGIYLWAMATVTGTSIRNPTAAAVNTTKGIYAPGTTNLGYLGATTANGAFSTSGWVGVDPQTGDLLLNLTNVASGIRAQGPQGEWLIYNVGRPANTIQGTNTPFTYLYQWNNTKLPGITDQWTPGINNFNMSAAYDWNVTLSEPLYPTFTSLGSAGGGFSGSAYFNATTGLYTNNPTIMRVFPGNVIFGQSSGLQQTPGTSFGVFGTPDTYTLWAINLNATRGPIGQVLYQRTYNAPAGNLTVCLGPTDGENNVFTIYYRETMQWSGYDLLTGNKLWDPTPSENPWNYYTGTTGLTNPVGLAYGRLYVAGYGGTLYAYNIKTGATEFTYGNSLTDPNNSTITAETVYGVYPTQVAAIADGKVFLVQEEHSLNSPAYRGARTRAVDAYTGELVWQIYGMSSWQEQAVADGYYTWFNLIDQQIYIIGPGPSATTVEAPMSTTVAGSPITIKGTVTDQSPNLKLKGTAAISDADQGLWMEYMVQSARTMPNAAGVPVTLTAIDATGVATEIAAVTSNSGGTFGAQWTPSAAGVYTIVANFTGTQSYGPSYATTVIGVSEASTQPSTSPTPTETVAPTETPIATPTASPSAGVDNPGSPSTETLLIAGAAAVIVIAVIAAALVLRKRK